MAVSAAAGKAMPAGCDAIRLPSAASSAVATQPRLTETPPGRPATRSAPSMELLPRLSAPTRPRPKYRPQPRSRSPGSALLAYIRHAKRGRRSQAPLAPAGGDEDQDHDRHQVGEGGED